MKCIRCECALTMDFVPLDERGAYSICDSCLHVWMRERGYSIDDDPIEWGAIPRHRLGPGGRAVTATPRPQAAHPPSCDPKRGSPWGARAIQGQSESTDP